MSIEIHLDGKPVTKLQAARSVANLDEDYEYHGVSVGEPNEDGWISSHEITVHGRHRAYGSMHPAEVSWPSIGSVPAAEARAFTEALALGTEIAELAEMIAAEQVTEFTTSSTGAPAAPCQRPGEHSPQLAGSVIDCDVAEHHGPARISEAAIDKALAATLGVCPASTGPDDDLDHEVYCDKQLGEDTKHAGNHHAEVEGGGEVAWGDKDDPYIRKGTRWPSDAGAASPFGDGPGCGQHHPNHSGDYRFACTIHRGGMHTAPGNPGTPGCQWPIRRETANPPRYVPPGTGERCRAQQSDGGGMCTAQPGHDGPEHVVYGLGGRELARFSADTLLLVRRDQLAAELLAVHEDPERGPQIHPFTPMDPTHGSVLCNCGRPREDRIHILTEPETAPQRSGCKCGHTGTVHYLDLLAGGDLTWCHVCDCEAYEYAEPAAVPVDGEGSDLD
jgi:hypothetical protein